MLKYIYKYIAVALLLCSCESEIPFEYNSIEVMHTIQAEFKLSDGDCVANVYVSSTRDVDTWQEEEAVSSAQVEITTPAGDIIPLSYDGDSLYVASVSGGNLSSLEGDYTLRVTVGEDTYSAACALPTSSQIGEPIFYWQSMMEGIGILIMKGSIIDTAGEDNYYRYSLCLPSGESYQGGVVSDNGVDGKVIDIIAAFNPDESLGYDTMSDDSSGSLYKLASGDIITIIVESIDYRPYDFLSTLGSSACNPICHIEGGALGYFLVSEVSTKIITFSADSVVEL